MSQNGSAVLGTNYLDLELLCPQNGSAVLKRESNVLHTYEYSSIVLLVRIPPDCVVGTK